MNRVRLNDETKKYLFAYYSILDEMIQKMTNAELKNSISYNFIVQMIPHHKAAIEMSENILKYTKNQAIQNIADNIIKEQKKSIANMRTVEKTCGEKENTVYDLYLYQRQIERIEKAMFHAMETAPYTNRLNCDFIYEMIPHHRGAVEMAETTLQFDICSELRPILKAIITSQKRGIVEMTNLSRVMRCNDFSR